jgi:hypothetical protein
MNGSVLFLLLLAVVYVVLLWHLEDREMKIRELERRLHALEEEKRNGEWRCKKEVENDIERQSYNCEK